MTLVPASTLSAYKSGAGSGRDNNSMTPAELAAYINDIVKNLPDDKSPEAKALQAIAAAITQLVDEVAALAVESERMQQFLDELDSDLGELEADYYGDYYDDYDDIDDWPSGISHYQPIIFSEQDESDDEEGSSENGEDKGRG